jgi:hypothetical protein
MACIDFRAAFDSCKHGFIWQALERSNVGPNLIHHMQTLYQGAKSSVLNDNTQTNWFPLTQSTRQGDPVAGYTFILLLEVLLNKIRHKIPALTVDNFSVGCIAYTDDLSVFLRTASDLRRLVALIRSFAPISGLHINVEKTEAMELGVLAYDFGIQFKTEMMITGLVFCKNPAKMEKLQLDQCLYQGQEEARWMVGPASHSYRKGKHLESADPATGLLCGWNNCHARQHRQKT